MSTWESLVRKNRQQRQRISRCTKQANAGFLRLARLLCLLVVLAFYPPKASQFTLIQKMISKLLTRLRQRQFILRRQYLAQLPLQRPLQHQPLRQPQHRPRLQHNQKQITMSKHNRRLPLQQHRQPHLRLQVQ